MATLRELCARAILKSSVFKEARCACDYYKAFYINDYKTKEFIWLLPLPVTVKEFMEEVSKKFCEKDHGLWPKVQQYIADQYLQMSRRK